MAVQYWVLRVHGRNRWQEAIYTGAMEYAFCRAAELAEQFQAEVTVFEAKPVRVVSIKDVSEKPKPEPKPVRMCDCGAVEPIPREAAKGYCRSCGSFVYFGEPEAPGVGKFHAANNLGVHYTCGHSTPEAPAPYEIVDGKPVYRPCGHRLERWNEDHMPKVCPVCAEKYLREAGAELKEKPFENAERAAAPGGTGGQARAEAGPGPGRG